MLRAWLRLIGTALGAAFVAAAAQLGIAQAAGIIDWNDVATAASWQRTLTWVAFAYLVAVLVGAAIGRRALRRPNRPEPVVARITAALAAGIGSALAVGLAWLPAHDARPPVSVHPELVVAMTAGVAIAGGVLLAIVALSVAPVAGGLRAVIAWTWLLAVGCVIAGVVSTGPDPAPRLGVLAVPSLLPAAWWSGEYVQVMAAAVLGFAVAGMARWGGANRFAVALAGLAGPAAVAIAVLLTDFDPVPLYAAGAGLLASVLVALPRRAGGEALDEHPGRTRSDHRRADQGEQPWADQAWADDDDADQSGPWPPDWHDEDTQDQQVVHWPAGAPDRTPATATAGPATTRPATTRSAAPRSASPVTMTSPAMTSPAMAAPLPAKASAKATAAVKATAATATAYPGGAVSGGAVSGGAAASPAPTIGRPPRQPGRDAQPAPLPAQSPQPERPGQGKRTPDQDYQDYHSWFAELGADGKRPEPSP